MIRSGDIGRRRYRDELFQSWKILDRKAKQIRLIVTAAHVRFDRITKRVIQQDALLVLILFLFILFAFLLCLALMFVRLTFPFPFCACILLGRYINKRSLQLEQLRKRTSSSSSSSPEGSSSSSISSGAPVQHVSTDR